VCKRKLGVRPAAAPGFVTAPDAIHNFGRKFRHCSAKTATTTKGQTVRQSVRDRRSHVTNRSGTRRKQPIRIGVVVSTAGSFHATVGTRLWQLRTQGGDICNLQLISFNVQRSSFEHDGRDFAIDRFLGPAAESGSAVAILANITRDRTKSSVSSVNAASVEVAADENGCTAGRFHGGEAMGSLETEPTDRRRCVRRTTEVGSRH
jgi:hypothetical protein